MKVKDVLPGRKVIVEIQYIDTDRTIKERINVTNYDVTQIPAAMAQALDSDYLFVVPADKKYKFAIRENK